MANSTAQRIDINQRIYAKAEVTEGTEPAITAANAFLCDKLASNIGSMPQAFLSRVFTGTMGAYQGKLGAIEKAKLSYSVEFRGNGSATLPPEYAAQLTSILPVSASNTISSTTTGGTTTTPTTASTTGIPASPGPYGPIMVSTTSGGAIYEMAWIASFSPNTSITFSQPVTALVSGSNLKPGLSYQTADSGHGSLTHQIFLDSGAPAVLTSDYVSFTGCKGSLKLDASKVGMIPKLTFDWSAITWLLHAAGTKLGLTVNNTLPQPGVACIVKIAGALVDIRGFTFDLGQVIGQKVSQNSATGVFSQVVTQRLAKGTLQIWNTGASSGAGAATTPNNIGVWQAGTLQELTLQWGNTLFNTVGIRIPFCQFTDVKYASDTGMLYDEISFQSSISAGQDDVMIGFG